MQTEQANPQIRHEGYKDRAACVYSGGGAIRGNVEQVRRACSSGDERNGGYAREAENELLSGNKKQE